MVFSSGVTSFINVVGNALIHNYVVIVKNDNGGTVFLARFVLYVIIKSRCKAHDGDPNWCISVPALYEREFRYVEELIPAWNADDKTFVAQIKKCVKLLK